MKETLYEIVDDALEAQYQINGHDILNVRYGTDCVTEQYGVSKEGINVYYLTSYSQDPIKLYESDIKKAFIVYRNAPVAAILQQKNLSDDFVQRTKHSGSVRCIKGHIINLLDYDRHLIGIEGDKEIYEYHPTLVSFQARLRQNKQELEENQAETKRLEEERQKAELEQKSAQEKARLTKHLNDLKNNYQVLLGQKEEMNRLTQYIRRQAKLRFHPIIDPIQSAIKFNNLYNGTTVVIAGGPGTGKTTTVIARLKYLTDLKSLEEDTKLNPEERRFAINIAQREILKECVKNDVDWTFFSPSPLLQQYLSQAMVEEQLSNPINKTQNWAEYRSNMMRDYGFIVVGDEHTPFRNSKYNDKTLLLANNHAIDDLNHFFLHRFVDAIHSLPEINESDYRWSDLANIIKLQLASINDYDINQAIRILNGLQKDYADECKTYNERYRELRDALADTLYGRIKDDEVRWKQIVALIQSEEGSDMDGSDTEDEETETTNITDNNIRAHQMIRNWLSPYALYLIAKRKLTERHTKLVSLLQPLISQDLLADMQELGTLSLFRLFARYTRGAKSIMLSGIPAMYKAFRRNMLKQQQQGWNIDLLMKIVDSSHQNGKGLHRQEQALLLGFTNTIIKALLQKMPDISGNYIDAYKLHMRPIIGIDESTDFSIEEIYAMMSFTHYNFSSVTISGDIMQRMTEHGIQSWDELKPIIPNLNIEQLNVSYRQSRKMLAVAQKLYEDTLGCEATYRSYMRETNVPEALAYVSDDEDDKIEWIEKRIVDVYNAYGKQLPSIAIFINNKEHVSAFADKLNETDFFLDNQLEALDGANGNALGSKSQVRVFPIDTVKGMEFDVVFFHDIDDTDLSDDMVKRYLYVGVSRAAFYLGATFVTDKPELSKYFIQGKTWANA